jgi:polyhydroxyalkanoate synthesis repressor PhaR
VNEKTVLIKRYDNRKLYDTSRSTYVTLEDIAGLIREGKEVKVVDAKSNEDLTRGTLAQIILEDERHKKNLLPLSFMYQLIKYGESVQGIFQEYLSTGFEAFLATQQAAQQHMRQWAEVGLGKEPRSEKAEPAADSGASLKDELTDLRRKVDELERRLKMEKEE